MGETEPKAVTTLERAFARTLAYLKVLTQARPEGQEWRVECPRTTSPPERVQRHFRQKSRQVMIAHSEKEADASIELGFPVSSAVATDLLGNKISDVARAGSRIQLEMDPWKVRTIAMK